MMVEGVPLPLNFFHHPPDFWQDSPTVKHESSQIKDLTRRCSWNLPSFHANFQLSARAANKQEVRVSSLV